jgi:hypothetical protein
VALLGEPQPDPPNLSAKIVKSASPDVVRLEIGLFNPRDAIKLQLILIDPKSNGTAAPIVAETRVAGLSAPVTGKLDTVGRFQEAIQWPIAGTFALIFLVFLYRSFSDLIRLGKNWSEKAGWCYKIFYGTLIGTAICTAALSWGIAWFAVRFYLK